MKPFYKIFCILIALLFSAEASFGFTLGFSETVFEKSAAPSNQDQATLIKKLNPQLEGQTTEILSTIQPEVLPTAIDKFISNSSAILRLSEHISRLSNDRISANINCTFDKFFIREILFPFHSFL